LGLLSYVAGGKGADDAGTAQYHMRTACVRYESSPLNVLYHLDILIKLAYRYKLLKSVLEETNFDRCRKLDTSFSLSKKFVGRQDAFCVMLVLAYHADINRCSSRFRRKQFLVQRKSHVRLFFLCVP
jgi:hypothetical protein